MKIPEFHNLCVLSIMHDILNTFTHHYVMDVKCSAMGVESISIIINGESITSQAKRRAMLDLLADSMPHHMTYDIEIDDKWMELYK